MTFQISRRRNEVLVLPGSLVRGGFPRVRILNAMGHPGSLVRFPLYSEVSWTEITAVVEQGA